MYTFQVIKISVDAIYCFQMIMNLLYEFIIYDEWNLLFLQLHVTNKFQGVCM